MGDGRGAVWTVFTIPANFEAPCARLAQKKRIKSVFPLNDPCPSGVELRHFETFGGCALEGNKSIAFYVKWNEKTKHFKLQKRDQSSS